MMDFALMTEYRVGMKERAKEKGSVSWLPLRTVDDGIRSYDRLDKWFERKGKRKEISFVVSYGTCR